MKDIIQFFGAVGSLVGAVAGMIGFAIGVVILTSMWQAWWLHPRWVELAQLLNLPFLPYWGFTAFILLFHALRPSPATQDIKKEYAEDTNKYVVWFGMLIIGPIITYYATGFML